MNFGRHNRAYNRLLIMIFNKLSKLISMKYSLMKGILKSLKYMAIFIIPVFVDKFIVDYPQLAQLTVGGVLVMIVNYLKIKCTK
jgi:hypothetical protein